jgi:hypothetical protein
MLDLNKKVSQKDFQSVTNLLAAIADKDKFITNSLYDFLQKFELYLNDSNENDLTSIFEILKEEELSLYRASEITNYLTTKTRERGILQAINVIKLMKSTILGLSTTEVEFGSPYGFLKTRQNFAKNNSIDSDILSLKEITSDVSSLMLDDLLRIETKLGFLKDLARDNASKTFNEQEIIRLKMTKLLTDVWSRAFARG